MDYQTGSRPWGANTFGSNGRKCRTSSRNLSAHCRYPPEGVRGVGYVTARAAGFGTIPDYGKTADAEICLLIQVENRAGLEALDEILEVDGIDGVFIGPADLSADLGHMSDMMHPEMQSVIMSSLEKNCSKRQSAWNSKSR